MSTAPSARASRSAPLLAPRLAVALLVVLLVLAFELLLDLVAVSAFPHHDSSGCAAMDTFCSPDGGRITGGALVFAAGNVGVLLTVVLSCSAAVLLLRRSPRSH